MNIASNNERKINNSHKTSLIESMVLYGSDKVHEKEKYQCNHEEIRSPSSCSMFSTQTIQVNPVNNKN